MADLETPYTQAPYVTVAFPHQKARVAVSGIVPIDARINPQRAVALAAFYQRRFNAKQARSHSQIFVFADIAAARKFADYQKPRASAPLAARDFKVLNALWPRTLAVYENLPATESRKATERSFYPQSTPRDWWKPLVTPRAR